MKKLFLSVLLMLPLMAMAKEATVCSPDGKLKVTVSDEGGKAVYCVEYNDKQALLPSALGFKADFGDFTQGLTITDAKESKVEKNYEMRQAKQSHINYQAEQLTVDVINAKKQKMQIVFNVSNNDVAFKYVIPRQKDNNPKTAVIYSETTSFRLPDGTTTFICPQSDPMVGWERTKPSYEEDYVPDDKMDVKSKFGRGYTFPCLFKTSSSLWTLISETGVSSRYCASHVSDFNAATGYTIAYPMAEENNGNGTPYAAIMLPGETPWRTITVGETLKPIVESTVAYDVVDPLYEPSEDYKYGRYTWSWLIWQDNSVCWNDQISFIDLASKMGYEYCLVDGFWDEQIGYDKIPALSKYAQEKGVKLMLWYNSNGAENDAPQGPRGKMDNSIVRDREMAWMKSIGVKGIKVDFFGGDKQETMKLYEDILFDANRYGIQVIFHGCTLPRGWERMYPNFISSEAVLASENVYFSEHHAKMQPFELTMHPFCRNAVATMDWGGVIMNKYMSRDNKSRHQRYTTDVFEIATAFINQAAINCVAIQPNNLEELCKTELDFLKSLPTTWDETRLVDGYPGKYVVMARRHGDKWYVAGLNANKTPLTLTIDLPMMQAGTKVNALTDNVNKKKNPDDAVIEELKIDKKGKAKITIQPNGGIVIF